MMTPYKNPERQKQAVKENAQKYRQRKLFAEKATLGMLDSLTLGKAKPFGMVWVEHTKLKKRCKRFLLPFADALRFDETLKKNTTMRLFTDKTFFAFSVPLEYDADSPIEKQIMKILDEIKKLKNLSCKKEEE